jgi:hypothetical protein
MRLTRGKLVLRRVLAQELREEPEEAGVQLPLANPSFAALLASVVRPTAILARLAAFTHRYYSAGIGPVACTRCGARTTLSPYERESAGPGAHGRGLAAACRACGEGVCSSLGAIALAQPSVQRLRREQRRIRAQPARWVDVGGSRAVLVRYESVVGSDAAEVLFAGNTPRVLDAAA